MSLNIVQDLTIEVDSLELLKPALKLALTLTGYRHFHYLRSDNPDRLAPRYPSEAAAWMMDFLGNPAFRIRTHEFLSPHPNPRFYWCIGRASHAGGAAPFEETIAMISIDEGVDRILERCAAVTEEQFFKACTREGPFDRCDGSVGLGYRLHCSPVSSGLSVDLCHIYYSK